MKKALVYGPLDLRIEERPHRTPAGDEVLAKMLFTTLTTANVRLYQGPLMGDLVYPVTLSYTGVAEVTDIGPEVTRVKPGDLVYPNYYRSCLKCRWCLSDRMVACENIPVGGHNMAIGEPYESALQEEILFPQIRMNPVPAGTPIEAAAMVGFFSVAMQAVTAVNPQPGETIFINGAGPIGWCSTQLCKLRGAKVVITEVRPTRMERAKNFGADIVVDATRPDAKQQVIEACGGPPEKIIEASGTDAGSEFAFDIVARHGHLALVGVSNFPFVQRHVVIKGVRMDGIGGAIKVPEIIQLIADRKIDISAAISHRYPFSQLREALEMKRSTPEAELAGVYVDESRMPKA